MSRVRETFLSFFSVHCNLGSLKVKYMRWMPNYYIYTLALLSVEEGGEGLHKKEHLNMSQSDPPVARVSQIYAPCASSAVFYDAAPQTRNITARCCVLYNRGILKTDKVRHILDPVNMTGPLLDRRKETRLGYYSILIVCYLYAFYLTTNLGFGRINLV